MKNTFLDDVVGEQSSNESTLAEAHTCPEFRRRHDGSSSSASNSGSANASLGQQSDLYLAADPELLVNTLQTLSTPPCSLRHQVPGDACQAEFTDVVPQHSLSLDQLKTLELWQETIPEAQLHRDAPLNAMGAMLSQFGNLLSPFSPPGITGINANLGAATAAAYPPPAYPPNLPWLPPVLSTIPPTPEVLAAASWRMHYLDSFGGRTRFSIVSHDFAVAGFGIPRLY